MALEEWRYHHNIELEEMMKIQKICNQYNELSGRDFNISLLA
jgi:hypothetical protein